MIIGRAHNSLEHDSQSVVQEAAAKLLEASGIIAKIEALADEYAEKVLPYSGTMPDARKQAQRWAVQLIADAICAEARYEMILVE